MASAVTVDKGLERHSRVRTTKKERIYALFCENVGRKFNSAYLHATFGSAFRSRVSDINNDPASVIRIVNRVNTKDDGEVSVYWSVSLSADKPSPIHPDYGVD